MEENDRAVAIVRGRWRGYEIRDPVTGESTPVDATVAAGLKSEGYSLYRPFPDGPVRLRDLMRFGTRGKGADLTTIVFAAVAGSLLGLATPIATGIVFSSAIPARDQALLLQIAAALIVGAVVAGLFQLTRAIAVLRLETQAEGELQAALWDRLLRLPAPFFRRFTVGDLTLRANGITAVRAVLTSAVITTIMGAFTSASSFALLFFYDVRLALVATVQANVFVKAFQFVDGLAKLRVAAAERRAFGIWAEGYAEMKTLTARVRYIGNRLRAFNAVQPVLLSLVVFVTVVQLGAGELDAGRFLAFNAAMLQFALATGLVTNSLAMVVDVIPILDRASASTRATSTAT